MIKKITIFFLILSFLAPSVADAGNRCSLCKKQIRGKYLKFDDGQIFCLTCKDKYTQCYVCGKPSKSTVLIDSYKVCRNCIVNLDKCSNCRKPIVGRSIYFSDIDLRLCEKCSRTIPRCDLCGRPEKKLIKAGHKQICKSCYKQASFCYICKELIEGRYSWFDRDDTKKYCQMCVNRYPECANCGAPAGRNSNQLKDKRVLCSNCYKESFFNAGKVKLIKRKVQDYLESSLGITVKHKIKYSLQGQDFIREKSEGVSGDINGLFYRENDTFEIFVLYGLRKKELYQVIPHEIAHAWTSENSKRELTLEEAEGFAQWVAYHALGNFGFRDYRETLLEGNSVYAKGLQKMLNIEKRRGKKGVFEHITRN